MANQGGPWEQLALREWEGHTVTIDEQTEPTRRYRVVLRPVKGTDVPAAVRFCSTMSEAVRAWSHMLESVGLTLDVAAAQLSQRSAG